jgi:hypothetical protein
VRGSDISCRCLHLLRSSLLSRNRSGPNSAKLSFVTCVSCRLSSRSATQPTKQLRSSSGNAPCRLSVTSASAVPPSSRSGIQAVKDQPHVTVSSRDRRHNTAQRATTPVSSSRSRVHNPSKPAREKYSCSLHSSRFQQRPLRKPTASLTAPCHSVDTPRNDSKPATRPKYSAVFCTRSVGTNGLLDWSCSFVSAPG